MLKTILMILIAELSLTAIYGDDYFIGTGTSAQSNIPFYGMFDYGWSKILYTKAELNAAGLNTPALITAIAFDVANSPNFYLMNDQSLYLRHTAATSLNNQYPGTEGFTHVLTNNYMFHGSGWKNFTFSASFAWNNQDNIEILWENHDGSWANGYPTFRYTSTTPVYTGAYKHQYSSFPTGNGNTSYLRPNIRITAQAINPPNPAINPIPPDGDIMVSLEPCLQWQSGGGAPTGYNLYFGTVNPPPFFGNLGNNTYWMPLAPLEHQQTYFWQVEPYNGDGPALNCPVWSFTTLSDQFIQIGSGNDAQRQPFGMAYGFERSAALYTADLIEEANIIMDRLAWFTSSGSLQSAPLTIYAKETTDDQLIPTTWDDLLFGATQVYQGNRAFVIPGWSLLVLDTPFHYQNGNLIIAVETNLGSMQGVTSYPSFSYTEEAQAVHQMWFDDASPPSGPGTVNHNLPNILLGFEHDPRKPLPFSESVNSLDFPVDWSQTHSGEVTTDRWFVTQTGYANNDPNELTAHFTPAPAVGISRLITPPLNTEDKSAVCVTFFHYYDDYTPGIEASLQYSYDLETWIDTDWYLISGQGNAFGEVSVAVHGLDSPLTYFAWTLDGDHYAFDYWRVDDILVQEAPQTDVAVVSIHAPEVVQPGSFYPSIVVQNLGASTVSFTARMTINTSYQQEVTVSNLAPGNVTTVSFPPIYMDQYTQNYSLVAGVIHPDDQNLSNNVLFADVRCLELTSQALGDVAMDPTNQLEGLVTFPLADPQTIAEFPIPPGNTNFLTGADEHQGAIIASEYNAGCLTTDRIWRIDNESMTLIGHSGVPLNGVASGGPGRNVIYGASSTDLYYIDPNTGNATLIGPYGHSGVMIGIAHDHENDILYGIDIFFNALFTINTSTGAANYVGDLGIDINYAQDCAFDQTTGNLYLAGYTYLGALYWIDTNDGSAWKIGEFPNGASVAAFAIYPPSEAPVVSISAGGILSWEPVAGASGYNIYRSDDPDGEFILYDSTAGTEFTDPLFPSDKAFYRVTAVLGTREKTPSTEQIKVKRYLPSNPQKERADSGPPPQ